MRSRSEEARPSRIVLCAVLAGSTEQINTTTAITPRGDTARISDAKETGVFVSRKVSDEEYETKK